MRSMITSALVALSAIAAPASALNIFLSNDDGFASAQLRETYRLLKAAGHSVIVVAPVDNESGQGGRAVFSNLRNLAVPSEFGIIPAGAPALGQDPTDSNIWYYNGTPAAVTTVGLDYVIPNFWGNRSIDLFVGGPNFGTNLGSFLYTLSGTMGGTYTAIGRGLPGIAFSGGNSEQRSYTWINKTTASGSHDPATIQGQIAVDLIQTLAKNTPAGQRLLPLGYGISVNTPLITSLTNNSCVNPAFVETRLSTGSITDKAVFNSTSGLFTYGNIAGAGYVCINGNCTLPGETPVWASGCYNTISVFTVDYDAPTGAAQTAIRAALNYTSTSGSTEWQAWKRSAENVQGLEERLPLRHE